MNLPARVYPSGLPCTVCDRSAGGARIRFQHSVTLPPVIIVVWQGGLAFEAKVQWRDGLEAGLAIQRSCDLSGMVPAAFAAVKAAWLRGGV